MKQSSRKSDYLKLFGMLAVVISLIWGCVKSADKTSPMEDTSKVYGTSAAEPRPAPPPMAAAESMPMASPNVPTENMAKTKQPETKSPPGTWKWATIRPNSVRLMIGDRAELPIEGMQFNVRIDGFLARVIMDIYVFNDRDRQYEGTFKLRLPNGASPFYLAFGESVLNDQSQPIVFRDASQSRKTGWNPEQILTDRKGQWQRVKEARMVPRQQAAYAYRETVHRRRVDPALMEWSGAGIFTTNLFPILPRQRHRIVVGYDVPLVRSGSDLDFLLDIPANVANITVDIHVTQIPGVSVQVNPQAEGGADHRLMHYRFENPLENTISVKLRNAGTLVLHGADADTGHYFITRFEPNLPETPAWTNPVAVFMVDVSLSSAPEKYNIWLQLLEAILEKNRDQIRRFAVMFFSVDTFWWKTEFVANTDQNVSDLMAFASRLALEGATDLKAALNEAAHPEWTSDPNLKWDLFLLSDGAATWGETDVASVFYAHFQDHVSGLFAYRTRFSGTDTRMLETLASQGAGAVFSITDTHQIPQMASAHANRPWRITSVRMTECQDLLIAGRPQYLFPHQRITLVGRGVPNSQTELSLMLEQDGKPFPIQIPMSAVLDSEMAARAYGQVAVSQLEEFKEATRDQSIAYARQFRITGQTCSLLMLETEADYQRYDIDANQDALLVKMFQASDIIAQVMQTLQQTMVSAKATFLAWMERMKSLPGLQFQLPEVFTMNLKRLPEEAFQVHIPPLETKIRTWKEIPGKIQNQLISRNPDYDTFSKEAQRRDEQLGPADGLKAMSSLVETHPSDTALIRDISYLAMQWGLYDQAYGLLKRVADLRPFEPQTYHGLGLCLSEMGKPDLAMAYFETVLNTKWDQRFMDIQLIAGMDYIRFLRNLQKPSMASPTSQYIETRLQQLSKQADMEAADLIVMITWNTDATDVDLHVVEPSGEECFYQHRKTRQGGELTRDVTQGFGPEMYRIKDAGSGTYTIRVKYYSQDETRVTTRTRVYTTIFRNWGSPKEQIIRKAVNLEAKGQIQEIARVTIRPWPFD